MSPKSRQNQMKTICTTIIYNNDFISSPSALYIGGLRAIAKADRSIFSIKPTARDFAT